MSYGGCVKRTQRSSSSSTEVVDPDLPVIIEAAFLTDFLANAEILLAELQTARARAEAAETQLQLEQQRMRMGRIPAAGYGPAAPTAVPLYAAGAPRFQQYYAAGMDLGHQGERHPVNQMHYAARGGVQPQRPNPPNQDQQRYGNYQQRYPRAGSEYTSTIYSDDSYNGLRR